MFWDMWTNTHTHTESHSTYKTCQSQGKVKNKELIKTILLIRNTEMSIGTRGKRIKYVKQRE